MPRSQAVLRETGPGSGGNPPMASPAPGSPSADAPLAPEILDSSARSPHTMGLAGDARFFPTGGPLALALRVPPALGRRFHIVRPLGSGAEGSVYLARDRHHGNILTSLKILRPYAARDASSLRL